MDSGGGGLLKVFLFLIARPGGGIVMCGRPTTPSWGGVVPSYSQDEVPKKILDPNNGANAGKMMAKCSSPPPVEYIPWVVGTDPLGFKKPQISSQPPSIIIHRYYVTPPQIITSGFSIRNNFSRLTGPMSFLHYRALLRMCTIFIPRRFLSFSQPNPR